MNKFHENYSIQKRKKLHENLHNQKIHVKH